MKTFAMWLRVASIVFFVLISLSLSAAEPAVNANRGDSNPADEGDRKVAPADTLTVVVLGEEDLRLELRVEAGGTIKFPLLGNVSVSGKTTAEVAEIIEEKLNAGYLVNPQVTINVKEYRSATVVVIGEVKESGAIPLPSERAMDIVEAIGLAGGFTTIAHKSKIDLTRKGKTTRHKLKDLLNVTDPRKKILLEPGDVIEVHDSFF